MTPDTFIDRLHDDFTFFMEAIWHDRNLAQYAPIGWVERDILDWIQNGPTRQGILAWRGFGKTHLVTAGVACWDLFRNPDSKILIVSKSEGEAKKTLRLIREWIDHVPFLKHLKPEGDLRDAATQFDVSGAQPSRDPSVAVKGIDGQITGTRASRVILDDVETKNNTKTAEAREDLNIKVRECSAIASYGDRRINYIGTYHHEESLYIKLSERGYAFRTWPILYPQTKDKILNLSPAIQKRINDGTNQPGDIVADYRISREQVIEQQAEGASFFAMQYMLICDLGESERYPLRLENLIVFPIQRDQAPISIAWGKSNGQGTSTRITEIQSLGLSGDALYGPIMFDPQWSKYAGTKMWIDPSGRGTDKTGYAIVGYAHGYLWVKAVGGLSGGYEPQVLSTLAQLARLHGATEIYIEDNFGQGMFEPLLRPVLQRHFLEPGASQEHPDGWKADCQTIRVHGQKELRIIENLEPVMAQHRLVVCPSVIENEDLQRQLTRITRQRESLAHEDELESLAMCISQWRSLLQNDPTKAADKEREDLINQQLQEMRQLAGLNIPKPTWFKHN